MKTAQSIVISAKQLTGHKMRTVLALIGIIVGVSAVIVMVSIGLGAEREVLAKISDMGRNMVIVNAGVPIERGGRRFYGRTPRTLGLKDVEALYMQVSEIKNISPYQTRGFYAKYGNMTTGTTVVGVSPEYAEIRNYSLASGDFISFQDDASFSRVAVLGHTVKEALFEHLDPTGETIIIGNFPFRVIGYLGAKGADAEGNDQDNYIFIPINTAFRRVFNLDYLRSIYIQLSGDTEQESVIDDIRDVLRHSHNLVRQEKEDDFTIVTQDEIAETHKETSESFTLLITSIAGISLLIGGIGVLSIMLIAIKERSREIGLRMSVGALRRDIMLQFILESSILGTVGGVLGIITGIIISWGLVYFAGWVLAISWLSVIVSFFFSFFVGMFFGVYPAYKASLLDPIVALRSE